MPDVSSQSSTSLYRSEIVSGDREGLGGVILTNPPGLKIYGSLLLLALAATTIALFTVTLHETVTADGRLRPLGGEVAVEAPAVGTLTSIVVSVGDEVQREAPLAGIASELVTSTGENLTPILLVNLEGQKRELVRKRSTTTAALEADLDEAAARLKGLRAEIASNERQRAILGSRREMAATQVDQIKVLVDKGFGAAIELTRRQETLLLASQDLESANARVEASVAAAAELSARIRGIAARQTSELVSIDREIADLDLRVASTGSSGDRTVRSPVAGRVATMPARVGQRVSLGSPILTIVPSSGALEIELSPSPQVVTHFQIGQGLRIQVEAYPYQRFGALTGTVVSVSGSAVRPSNGETASPGYSVKVALQDDLSDIRSRGFDLRPDMGVTAVSAAKPLPLWKVVLGPMVGLWRRD